MTNFECNIAICIYFAIGLWLTAYWWLFRGGQKRYLDAKNSKEGVEDGMAVLMLLGMVWFWPLKLIRDTFRKIV